MPAVEQGRRELIKKAAAGGAIAWTAPVVVSSAAFAQGTQQCPGFTIENLTGPDCSDGFGNWVLRWTVEATAFAQVTIDGCGAQEGPTPIQGQYDRTFLIVTTPCCLRFTTDQLDSVGNKVCTSIVEHYFDCA